ncbi:alpha N-terminal protein methyltransferase 1 [Phoenix dactylifera]|uniref:Alpha N-terminal protein methyltransferase 1 n=1 Tax=Phoenix dactylifera TaxID=42345 RepID=A0A8B7C819_PHODC|nr:alpha N-terminal protein methyltransferase 1 [Phoenix dactylifera]XP_008793568.2 alpha N-terminal protein methyltransferase 1 [Phoenix dactylifera]
MDAGGLDSDGRGFSSSREMWREEIGIGEAEGGSKRHEWYRKGIAYWQAVEASVDGVLGGYGHVNEVDVKGSEAFLNTLLPNRFGTERRHLVALDCGSGIGRVTKNLLLRYFNEVDLVEPVSHFLEAARENLALDGDSEKDAHKAVNFYCVPLQEFTPEAGRYDVIWIQWCVGQLPDDDFISFFKRAKAGLKPNGLFVVKENIARKGFVLDKEDHSITRSDLYFKELFNQCGLYIYSTKDQKGFPEEIFPVKMYALVTEKPKVASNRRAKTQRHKPAVIKS